MKTDRRPYTPEKHLALLISGLSKLQKKLADGELVEWGVEMDDPPQLVDTRRQRPSESSRLLDIEGGYVPGKYKLADWLVAQSINTRDEHHDKEQ